MNLSWYIFYGTRLHMGRQEVINSRFGEMEDLISCLSIYNGAAEQATKKKPKSFDEIMQMK